MSKPLRDALARSLAVTEPRAPSYLRVAQTLREIAAGGHSINRNYAEAVRRAADDDEPIEPDLPPTERQAVADYHRDEWQPWDDDGFGPDEEDE